MKRIRTTLMAAFCLLLSYNVGNAYSVYFAVASPNLDLVHTFDVEVVGADVSALTLTIYDTTVTTSPIGLPGAVPIELAADFPWDIYKTTSPNGVSGLDWTFGTFPLSPGVVFSLSDTTAFTLANWYFGNADYPGGVFPLPFDITSSDITDGRVYTFTAIPIPSTILLLGGGLVALVAVRRRRS